MKASWNWLSDYVSVKAPVTEVIDRLTMAGLTVEGLEETADDFILEVEITSNRPDWLCHLGIARELAALYGLHVAVPDAAFDEGKTDASADASLGVPAPDLCPWYTGRIIKGVKVGPSPAWLKSKIESLGMRSVNNVVDVTNYVLYECGQPLHAFDLDKVAGKRIIVRRAGDGEVIKLIDGSKHALKTTDLVIADAKEPIALAGIMGGLQSEIGDSTTNVFLESAKFDQYSIRITGKRLGISTDASYRFERGVDLEGVGWASRRCAKLIVELGGGTISMGMLAVGEGRSPKKTITLRMKRMAEVLGMSVPVEDSKRILTSLGITVEKASHESIVVDAPSFRGDLREEIDLIEEVARINGYDRIPLSTGLAIAAGTKSARERVTETVETVLTGAGLFGCVSYSLVSGDVHRSYSPWSSKPPVFIENRAGQENAFMRPSIVPSVLCARKTNEDRKVPNAELFEIAHVYLASDDVLPAQPLMAALVMGGDFLRAKGVVEKLISELAGPDAKFLPADMPHLAPGMSVSVELGGRRIGYLGRLEEGIRARVDLREPVIVAEIDLTPFETMPVLVKSYVPLQRLPAVDRDLAIVVGEGVSWAAIEECVRACGARNLESVSFASLYRGKPIPEGEKCVAFRMVFRAPDRTLTGEEADESTAAIMKSLAAKFSARMR